MVGDVDVLVLEPEVPEPHAPSAAITTAAPASIDFERPIREPTFTVVTRRRPLQTPSTL